MHSVTGAQTILSSGGTLFGPYGLAVGFGGQLFVPDADAFALQGGVLRIDPLTGQQTVLTSSGFLSEPDGIAIAPVPEASSGVFSTTALIIMAVAYFRWRRKGAAA